MLWTPSRSTRSQRFLKYHLPAIAYAAAIIAVSSIPNLHIRKLPDLPFDKIAHVAEYAVFAILVYRSISDLRPGQAATAGWISLALLCLFAALDEVHQQYIPGRNMDRYDLAADVLGGTLALLVLVRAKKRQAGQ